MLGVKLPVMYPVANGTDMVPATALIKPKITDGSQWSPDLKPAVSIHVMAQPLRHDSS